jgi:hypothetical protein
MQGQKSHAMIPLEMNVMQSNYFSKYVHGKKNGMSQLYSMMCVNPSPLIRHKGAAPMHAIFFTSVHGLFLHSCCISISVEYNKQLVHSSTIGYSA